MHVAVACVYLPAFLTQLVHQVLTLSALAGLPFVTYSHLCVMLATTGFSSHGSARNAKLAHRYMRNPARRTRALEIAIESKSERWGLCAIGGPPVDSQDLRAT